MSNVASRDRDIDFAKGLACLCMAMGHIGFQVDIPVVRGATWYPAVIIAEISVALFFMASGMNVLHYVDHSEGKKGWGPTRTYLITNVLLFVCGLAYNINRQSLGLMDLFQSIAVATFVTYIPFRRKWPTWAIIIIAIELFFISFGFSTIDDAKVPHGYIVISAQEFARAMKAGYAHGDLMGNYIAMLSELRALPVWQRFLFVHFSALPWTGFALLGGAIFRLAKTKWEWILWLLFGAALAASFALPFFIERNMIDYYCRGKADYVFRYMAVGGFIFLLLRRFYQGKSRGALWIEFIGRESFLFFIVHWIYIEVLTTASKIPIWHLPVTAAVYWLTTITIRRLAKTRDRRIMNRDYAIKWFGIMIVFSVAAVAVEFGMPMQKHLNVNIAHLLSFPSAIAFAMAFPSLRAILKKKPRPNAPAAPEQEASPA